MPRVTAGAALFQAQRPFQDPLGPTTTRWLEGVPLTRQGRVLGESVLRFIDCGEVYYGHTSGATRFDFPTGPPSSEEVRRAQNERKEMYSHRSRY